MENQQKGKDKEYISLQDATKLCSYSQEYLSLRARHGKLRSVKFGRNWVTTKEWLEEYLHHNGNGNGHSNVKKIIEISVPENLPVGEPIFLKELYQPDYGQVKKLDFGNLRPLFAAVLAFVLLIGTGVFGKENLKDIYKEISPVVSQLAIDSGIYEIAHGISEIRSLNFPEVNAAHLREVIADFGLRAISMISEQKILVGNVSVSIGETTKASGAFLRDYSNWIAKKTTGNFLVKGLAKNYSKVDQVLKERLARDFKSLSLNSQKLNEEISKRIEDISEKYFTLNYSLEKKIVSSGQNIKRSSSAAGNFVNEKISEVPRFISQTFEKAYQSITSPIRKIIPGRGLFADKEEFEKLKSKMEGFEKQPVVIKRVEIEKVVEPVKEITREIEHVQKITKVEEEALKKVRGDIEYLQSEIGKRLYAPGGVVSQTIYVKEPIQSPKIYQENGEIVLQTRGSGNVILSAATGLQMYGSQVVIDSTSVLNPMVYIADQTRIDGPVTAQTITLSPPSNFTGSVLSVGGTDGSKFWVNQDGSATLLGNFTITGGIPVTGNQTYTGSMTISTSSASAALTVTQSGAGPIFNFTSTGSGVANNLGVISGATTGAVLAVSQTGTGLVIDATGAIRLSEAGLSIPGKVADDLLFATYFNSQSLTGSRGQLAVYSDSDNVPTFQLVDDSSGIAPGGRGLLFSYSGETLYYPASGNIGAATGTISFWYSPDFGYSTTTNKYLFETQNHLRIIYNGSAQKFVAQAYDGADWSTSTATSSAQTFSADNWIHIAVAFAASSSTAPITIYVNNQAVSDTDIWTPQSLPIYMYIGSDSSGTNQAQGLITDFAIFDRVLTQQEIQQIYHLKRPIEDYASSLSGSSASQYARVITVAKWGGDYNTITGALNSIIDNAAGSPYLVQVMPGTYSEQVTMKDYVDIIAPGGPEVTKIQQTTATTTITASYSLLQGFTVEKTTDNANAIIAVSSTSAVNGRLEDLKIIGAGTASQIGVFIGNSATTTLNQLRFSTLNTGIKQTGAATTTLTYSEISATTDIDLDAGIVNSAFNNLKGTTNFDIASGATINSYKDTYAKVTNSGTFNQKDYERNDAVTGLTVKQSGSGRIFLATSTSSMTSAAFQITNLGSGNAFVVEDSDTDATPFIIDASGNVAIGTTTARYLVDVWGDLAVGTSTDYNTPALYVNTGDSANYVGVASSTPSAAFAVQGGIVGSGNVNFYGAAATTTIGGGLVVGTNTLWAPTGGNVGIATTSPRYKLDVWGDLAVGTSTATNIPVLYVDSGTGYGSVGIGTTTSMGLFNVGTSTSAFVVTNAGLVGVNTTTPRFTLDVNGTIGGIASNLTLARISGSTYSTVQDMQTQFHSSGWVSGGTITDNGDGTISITAGTGWIRDGASATSTLYFFDWPALASQAIADGAERFILVNYNSGAPNVTLSATETWDRYTSFPIGYAVRDGSTIHVTYQRMQVGDHASSMVSRMWETDHVERDNFNGGLVIGEATGRKITVTAGTLWMGLSDYAIAAIDTSGSNTFDRYYRNGAGGWTKQSATTTWDNIRYDDGTGTIATMTDAYYSAQYFYLETDGELASVYGQNQYTTLGAAEDDTAPGTIPIRLQKQSILIGRIVFQKNSTAASSTESAFSTTFAGSQVTDHGNLAGLSDDDHTQYALLAGRAGGQSLIGGINANNALNLQVNSATS
ncbi:MAG: hypothetical protein HYW69_01150, partial [Candidatus Nealsonbacteria bacterium]|nr:hypothetical protein [Candidatus Nealsonbacteria bacterium]